VRLLVSSKATPGRYTADARLEMEGGVGGEGGEGGGTGKPLLLRWAPS